MTYITSKLIGGLGNQMFQYAAGRALSLRYNVPLYLDIEWYHTHKQRLSQRAYQLNVFPNINAHIKKIFFLPSYSYFQKLFKYIFNFSHEVQEPYFAYWPEFSQITPPAKLNGYWQCQKYFLEFKEKIYHDFIFPQLPQKAIKISKEILNTQNSVSVHIRRGDYISNPQAQAFHGNLQQDYYSKALKIIKYNCGESKLFIFSDDPQWVRQNFDCCGHDATIVDLASPDTPHHDMHLMSLCKHHVIANSSFSWWGAWLAKEPGITIAPRKWFAKKSFEEYKDIYCDNWIIL